MKSFAFEGGALAWMKKPVQKPADQKPKAAA
jgi:hypothetical protein